MNFQSNIVEAVNQYLTAIYHHSQGEANQAFRDRCCKKLKKLIDFDQISWLIKAEKPTQPSAFDRTIYDSNEDHYYSSLERYYKTDNSGVYHVISLFRKNADDFNSQDKYLFEFVLPHMAASFRLNILSSFNRGLDNTIDHAVCDDSGKIIEAEEGFYQQLSNQGISCATTGLQLAYDGESNAYFVHQSNLTFYATKKFGYHYLELDRSINDFNTLTNKQKEVCYLLKKALANDVIAAQLKSSKKTVENHLSAIYEKLGIQGRGSLVSILNK